MDCEPPRFPTPTPTFLSFGMSRVNFLDLKRSPLEQLRSVRFAVGKRGTGYFNLQMEFLNCVLNFFFDWEWESEFRLTREFPPLQVLYTCRLKTGSGSGSRSGNSPGSYYSLLITFSRRPLHYENRCSFTNNIKKLK
jgi:hypothetical protein